MRKSFHHGLAGTLFLGTLMSVGPLADSQGPPVAEAPKLGEAGPDFALSNIEGKRVQLKDYRGKKHVVLVFYPALFRTGG